MDETGLNRILKIFDYQKLILPLYQNVFAEEVIYPMEIIGMGKEYMEK